ncbi:MAG: anthranilate synthase component I [Methanohalobium sp.]|uniref:anthranilate synthase component I n=1 Tax=Methanohalobium sp. TaxID=2837493 RepID=UPI00397CEDF4
MISFDLDKNEFINLVERSEKPAIVQLMAKVETSCTPLQLYTLLQESKCSYLLESVEKEKRHARYSFVGFDPDALVTISDRNLKMEFSGSSELMDYICSKLGSVCTKESAKYGVFQGKVKNGYDILDAFRVVFPTADGVKLLNQKNFDRQTFLGGAIGYNGYDIVYDCWLDVDKKYKSNIPDLQYALTTRTFVFDHLTGDVYIVVTPFIPKNSNPESVYDNASLEAKKLLSYLDEASGMEISTVPESKTNSMDSVCNIEKNDFEEAVAKAKQHILDGDIFQVVLSRRYAVKINQTPLDLYKKLRNINPSPYMYIFNFKDLSIVGASPETLMTVHNREVITNPIAGTCSRGIDENEDRDFASRMLDDEKERAEHVMLVDLGRNDVRMVSKSGSVKLEDFMKVVKYSHLQHIESTVKGTLRDECDQFDATRAIFPAGTLSGAPKIRAMEIIDELENTPRGIYGGGVGYYSWNGDADFAIVIRTLLINGDTAYVQAGAGIVADSAPENEYEETERKMAAMMSAIRG